MTCFNSIANCCPPPPPEEPCCISLSDITSLFPSGLSLSISGNTVSIPNTDWTLAGCCAYKSVLPNLPVQKNCTQDWIYNSSEKTKCENTAAKLKTKAISVEFGQVSCGLNECPEIILAARTSTSIQEKAERVVTSEFKILQVTVSVGKFSRTCGSGGTPQCVYVIGVSVYAEVYAGGATQKYKRAVNELEYLDADLVACCNIWSVPPPSVDDLKAQWYQEEVTGVDQFPLCNYLPEGTNGGLVQVIDMSRVKVVTSLNSPITFSKNDPAPDFCNYDSFCLSPNNSTLDKVTVTFNRTLPPVYESKSFTAFPGNEKCCVNRVINSFYNPPEAYDIYGPNLWTTSGGYTLNPPSPGKQQLSSNLLANCYPILSLGSCMCGIPGGVGWRTGFQCCPYPTLPVIWPNYEADGEFKFTDSFSYTSVTGNDPIIHEYSIGSWTLTF